jgi:hypothetical protein
MISELGEISMATALNPEYCLTYVNRQRRRSENIAESISSL